MLLIDKRDYGKSLDQLEKNYLDLNQKQKSFVKKQFDRRLNMQNVSKKIAVSQSIDEIVDNVIEIEVEPIIGSNKKYLINDSIKTENGYINVKTNYEEKDGQILLEEYIVDKNGKIETYDNIKDFVSAIMSEGLF
jgi:hypothetical protein